MIPMDVPKDTCHAGYIPFGPAAGEIGVYMREKFYDHDLEVAMDCEVRSVVVDHKLATNSAHIDELIYSNLKPYHYVRRWVEKHRVAAHVVLVSNRPAQIRRAVSKPGMFDYNVDIPIRNTTEFNLALKGIRDIVRRHSVQITMAYGHGYWLAQTLRSLMLTGVRMNLVMNPEILNYVQMDTWHEHIPLVQEIIPSIETVTGDDTKWYGTSSKAKIAEETHSQTKSTSLSLGIKTRIGTI